MNAFTRVTTRVLAPVALAAALAACAPRAGMGSDGHAADIPAAKPTGAALTCLSLPIGESRVRDDWTIDFRSGGRWYRNTLPNRCNGLGFERAFAYSTSLTQLCNVDIITVIQTGAGGGMRGSCGLGQFVPVELAR